MIDNKYAAVIVGFGGMGNWHREILADFENIFCAGTFDISLDRQEVASQLGLHAFASLNEVLEDEKIDIIVIATPNDVHKEIALKAMNAGKNVVCEKPVTLSSKDLQDMIDCANKNEVMFTVHQNRRWDEDFLTMKRIYDEGVLGEIFNIESRVHGSRGIPGDWRGTKEQGGGMILDWGVHILDQILLMVPEKVKSVYAKLYHVTNEEVDDGFKIILTFEFGKTALMEVGTSNFISLPRWYMQGINGTAVIDDFGCTGKIVNIQNYEKREVIPVKTAAGLTKTMAPRTDDTISEGTLSVVNADIHDFYKNVAAYIAGNVDHTFVKHNELLRCMKLMEAVFESDLKNQVVLFE